MARGSLWIHLKGKQKWYILFGKELYGHECEQSHAAGEENEDVKDVWDGTTNVPERTKHLQPGRTNEQISNHKRERERERDFSQYFVYCRMADFS